MSLVPAADAIQGHLGWGQGAWKRLLFRSLSLITQFVLLMKVNLLFTLFILILTEGAVAQTRFRKASVITSNGDTLHGYVESMEWVRTPDFFSFSLSPAKTETKNFTVREAKTVVIEEGLVYQRFVVSISMNQTEDAKLDFVIDTTKRTEVVFLKLLAQGDKMNLYAYRDKLKDRYYLQTPTQETPVELIWKKELKDDQIHTIDFYRQQLTDAAIRSGTFTSSAEKQIATVRYSDKSLTHLVNQLNGRPEVALTRGAKAPRQGRYFVGLGINNSVLTFKGETLINADGLDANGNTAYRSEVRTKSLLPVVCGGYDVFFHPSLERTYLRLEGAVTAIQAKTTSVFKFSRPSDEELTNRYELFGVFVSLAPQLIYEVYQRSNFRLFAGAGIMLRHAIYPKQTLYQTTNKHGQGYADQVIEEYFRFSSFAGIPMGKAGATIQNKWSVWGSWLASRYLTPSDKTLIKSVRESSWQAGVSYLF